jgi:hypothetical protein
MFRRTTIERCVSAPGAGAGRASLLKPNKVVLFFSSLTERTSWPLWKLLQLRSAQAPKGLDISMLAFTHEHGCVEARLTKDPVTPDKPRPQPKLEMNTVRPPNLIEGHPDRFSRETLHDFLKRSYDPSKPTYFVYGGHGMGDYLDIEEGYRVLQVRELAEMMEGHRYEGMVFDSCCMANLDCAYYLKDRTNWIGACQGYLWEDDTNVGSHVLNARSIEYLSDPARSGKANTFDSFRQIQKEFCERTSLGDFSILEPNPAVMELLYNGVLSRVLPHVYEKEWRMDWVGVQQRAEELRASLEERKSSGSSSDLSAESLATTGDVCDLGGLRCSIAPITARDSSSNRLNLSAASSSSSSVSGRAFFSSIPPVTCTNLEDISYMVLFRRAQYPLTAEDRHLLDLRSAIQDYADHASERAPWASFGRYLESNPRTRDESVEEASLMISLLNQVVKSYVEPRDPTTYATPLAGMSLTAHEASYYSQLVIPPTINYPYTTAGHFTESLARHVNKILRTAELRRDLPVSEVERILRAR